ncbi:MAG: hypothetical protein NVS2B16_12820 [Chloroflexota bacterium]
MTKRIIVLEDEREVRGLLYDVLDKHEYEVINILLPENVLSNAAQFEPSLFLVDVMLPHMSGIELAQQLRARGFADTPMIAMSASRLMTDLASESELFQAVIRKPFDIDDLVRVIERQIGPP